MISYSIDASVYAYPFQKTPSDPSEIYKYCKNINDLCDIVNVKQPRNKKIYLSSRDIKKIAKNRELNFIVQDINVLKQVFNENDNEINILDEAYVSLDNFFNRFLFTSIEDKLPEKIIFENWFNIENVSYDNNKIFSLPDDINKALNNKDLKKYATKNIAKIAYLNEYIYKNDKLHCLILGCNIPSQTININSAEFNIIMAHGSNINNGKTYNYVIKDAPQQNISIENQSINISTLDTLIMSAPNSPQRKWETVLNDAEKDFKHLKICPEVKASLKQYINTINIEKNKLPKDVERIDKWIEEGPSSIYENLKALNIFVSTAKLYPVPINSGERYCCNDKCEFYKSCGSNIRFFGVDCCDESDGIKGNIHAEADRKRKSSDGDYPIYWTHLRLRSYSCDDPLWFLTLRIHFRLLEPLSARKIEIGWIGRHLYRPCPKKKKNLDCNDRLECSLNQKSSLYDLNADELTNYLKQWPKQEPASSPPETKKY
jgi:hypothetical protein